MVVYTFNPNRDRQVSVKLRPVWPTQLSSRATQRTPQGVGGEHELVRKLWNSQVPSLMLDELNSCWREETVCWAAWKQVLYFVT